MASKTLKNKPITDGLNKTRRSLRNPSIALQRELLLADINISPKEAMEARLRLKSFEEDWNARGMEAYDEL